MGKRNSSSLKPSASMLTGDEDSSCRELALVTQSPITPFSGGQRFSLPPGWGVEEVPRSDGSRIDRYYLEPGTGQKFRSMREVERHLNGETVTRSRRRGSTALTVYNRSKSSSRKMIVYGGKMLRLDEKELSANRQAIVPSGAVVNRHYELPDGWIVEEVPRKFGNSKDKYYYEPGTGRKFRSRAEVERHLTELSEHISLSEALEELNENRPLSKMFKLHHPTTNSASQKRKTSREDSVLRPPSKVNWVLASPKGDEWNPFIGDTLVSDSVKQEWSNRFTSLMNNETSA
nr:methyl-CpG-binding domain-containing protein 7-like [Ipomoea trifida]